MINVGELNHPFHPHGNHLRQIAQDGRLVRRRRDLERFGGDDRLRPDRGLPVHVDRIRTSGTRRRTRSPRRRSRTTATSPSRTATRGTAAALPRVQGHAPDRDVSQNVCGEWYFPWHSHALNEFTNFDEGFGGMAHAPARRPARRLLRVPDRDEDPGGTLNSGTLRRSRADDTTYYKVNSTTTDPTTTDWYGQFSGISAGATQPQGHVQGQRRVRSTTGPTDTQTSLASCRSTGRQHAARRLGARRDGTGANTSYGATTAAPPRQHVQLRRGDWHDRASTGPRQRRAPFTLDRRRPVHQHDRRNDHLARDHYRGERWRKGRPARPTTAWTSSTASTASLAGPTSIASTSTSPTTTGAAGAENGNPARQSRPELRRSPGSASANGGPTHPLGRLRHGRLGNGPTMDSPSTTSADAG